ncbi:MAG: type II secretion system protein GspJ [Verrucomicrobiota bacterium]
MSNRGFTLIEILAAALVSAMVLLVIYGTFQRAVQTRDSALERTRQARLRTRAAALLRNDLRNAYLSGGLFACTMEGGAQSQKSRFPGYLRFTTTTGINHPGEAYGDVQQIEYYLIENSAPSADANTGILVRAITRDLLTVPAPDPDEQQLLARVQTFTTSFYDGQNWQDSWPASSGTTTLPEAIRVRFQQTAPSPKLPDPPPLEILVPLTTVALTSTAATTGT